MVSSLHCVGMCGPILCSFNIRGKNLFIYHIGKFLSYISLALVLHFSTFSFLLNFKDNLKLYIFILLILFYVLLLWGLIFKKKNQLSLFDSIYQKAFSLIGKSHSESAKGFFIGGLSGFLPCAILYSFLLSISMIERVEVIVLSVFAFSLATALGLSFFHLFLNRLVSKFSLSRKWVNISFVLFSFLIILYRFLNFDLDGLCSNAL